MSLPSRDFSENDEADATSPVASYRRRFEDGNPTAALAHEILQHQFAAFIVTIVLVYLRIDSAVICREHDSGCLAKIASPQWLKLHRRRWAHRRLRSAQFASHEFAPIGTKAFPFEKRRQPRAVEANERALDTWHSRHSNLVDGFAQQNSLRANATIRRHDETGNHPEMPSDRIISIAHGSSVDPQGLTGQAAAIHNPPKGSKAIRDVPEQSLAPQLLFALPQPLQLGGTDSGQVHHLRLGCCLVWNSDTPRSILMRSNHGLSNPHSPKVHRSSAGGGSPWRSHHSGERVSCRCEGQPAPYCLPGVF